MNLSAFLGRAEWARFYERGCQEKYFPTDGRQDKQAVLSASPASVETNSLFRRERAFIVRHCVVCFETEKRLVALVADHGSI